MTITLKPDGQLNVTGPIENVILCYGLLKGAEVVIADHARENRRRVIPALAIPGLPKA